MVVPVRVYLVDGRLVSPELAVAEPMLAAASNWHVLARLAGRYVPAGSALDREALRRGNSVYFPDRAIPMLPESLSATLLAAPGVDRLVLVIVMAFDERGERGRTRFYDAVIRSRARLTYEQAAAAIEQGDESVPEAAMLRDLARLTRILRERRRAAGSLDFELPSPTFVLDEPGTTRYAHTKRRRAGGALRIARWPNGWSSAKSGRAPRTSRPRHRSRAAHHGVDRIGLVDGGAADGLGA
jgi:hypothetical protein